MTDKTTTAILEKKKIEELKKLKHEYLEKLGFFFFCSTIFPFFAIFVMYYGYLLWKLDY